MSSTKPNRIRAIQCSSQTIRSSAQPSASNIYAFRERISAWSGYRSRLTSGPLYLISPIDRHMWIVVRLTCLYFILKSPAPVFRPYRPISAQINAPILLLTCALDTVFGQLVLIYNEPWCVMLSKTKLGLSYTRPFAITVILLALNFYFNVCQPLGLVVPVPVSRVGWLQPYRWTSILISNRGLIGSPAWCGLLLFST